MKSQLQRIVSAYVESWWLPGAICLLSVVGFIATALVRWRPAVVAAYVLLLCVVLAFLGIVCAGVWNLVKRRWAKGLVDFVMLGVCGVAAFLAVGFLVMASMFAAFGTGEDGFADDLTIPADIEVSEPLEETEAEPGGEEDAFQRDLMRALETPASGGPTVTARVGHLLKLHRHAPRVLKRHLATSPAWRLFTEDGNRYATRRWRIGPRWSYSMHGYYTQYDVGLWADDEAPRFQSRFTIGFSGEPWARVWGDATRMGAGQTAPLKLSIGNQMHESRCIVQEGDIVVEVFEQSSGRERRLTKAALAQVEQEMAPLAAQPTWEKIRETVPPGSIRQGKPSFDLRDAFQPGIYNSEIWINPGEPGMIYLKAFEVTQGTPLSVQRLKERSNEWVGWSENRSEQFFSNTHFSIYEGDWGKPYAARFEIWFVPDSGEPERKLMEKCFKIEGWQR